RSSTCAARLTCCAKASTPWSFRSRTGLCADRRAPRGARPVHRRALEHRIGDDRDAAPAAAAALLGARAGAAGGRGRAGGPGAAQTRGPGESAGALNDPLAAVANFERWYESCYRNLGPRLRGSGDSPMDRRTFLQLAAGFSLGPISGSLSATAQTP